MNVEVIIFLGSG